jgi:hypothetical protein
MTPDQSQLIEDLEALYALLEPPYAWCKGLAWREEKRAPDGVARCLVGGIRKVCYYDLSPMTEALKKTLAQDSMENLVEFNDTHKKRDVLDLIQRTIDRVRASLTFEREGQDG